jgi:hypothetical protein
MSAASAIFCGAASAGAAWSSGLRCVLACGWPAGKLPGPQRPFQGSAVSRRVTRPARPPGRPPATGLQAAAKSEEGPRRGCRLQSKLLKGHEEVHPAPLHTPPPTPPEPRPLPPPTHTHNSGKSCIAASGCSTTCAGPPFPRLHVAQRKPMPLHTTPSQHLHSVLPSSAPSRCKAPHPPESSHPMSRPLLSTPRRHRLDPGQLTPWLRRSPAAAAFCPQCRSGRGAGTAPARGRPRCRWAAPGRRGSRNTGLAGAGCSLQG